MKILKCTLRRYKSQMQRWLGINCPQAGEPDFNLEYLFDKLEHMV